ncbi:MAG: DNA cytosine methyltransferase [Rhodomicrobium sp.]|nr:DNA cytosine methyltransferase [Rhodomicrobium sp.]
MTVLAANDIDPAAAQTFAHTHPSAKFISGPIGDLTSEDFLKATGLERGQLDILAGGPPCQAFSVYNHKRGLHDARSELFRDYLRIVEGLQPKWIVMENVTGILSCGAGRAVEDIRESLERLGYNVEMRTLKAEEYGVPQERRRVFFVGNRMGLPIVWPQATHGPGLLPFINVSDAISDLPALKNGENNGKKTYRSKPKSAYQKELREGAAAPLNHDAAKLQAINIERMKYIPQGGSWRDIPFDLLPAGMKRARRCDHTKRYGRLHPKGLASTILTKCDLHWGPYIHPEQDRILTVREAARFQSFPDWFEFCGSRTEQYVQVGNAVPPLLGRRIAEAILLANTKRKQKKSRTPVYREAQFAMAL